MPNSESQPILSGTELIDAFQSAICEVERCVCESMPCEHVVEMRASRVALEEYVAKQEAEVKARGELWGRICETLHACCQKYHLGLGGEHVDELVVAEVDRLREAITGWRGDLMRAGGALRSGSGTRTSIGRVCFKMREAIGAGDTT